jgi:hypothetical protein
MSTTVSQDRDFLKEVIPSSLLEDSIEWIRKNMEVNEVFEESEIIDFASNKKPEDVFDTNKLEDWAESNGYVKG